MFDAEDKNTLHSLNHVTSNFAPKFARTKATLSVWRQRIIHTTIHMMCIYFCVVRSLCIDCRCTVHGARVHPKGVVSIQWVKSPLHLWPYALFLFVFKRFSYDRILCNFLTLISLRSDADSNIRMSNENVLCQSQVQYHFVLCIDHSNVC